jgi:hypothetical protein
VQQSARIASAARLDFDFRLLGRSFDPATPTADAQAELVHSHEQTLPAAAYSHRPLKAAPTADLVAPFAEAAAVDFSADPFVLELSRASHAFDDKLGRLQPRAGSAVPTAAPALSTDGFDPLLFGALMPRQPLAHDDVTTLAEAERHSKASGSDLYPREPNAKGAESESPDATGPTRGEMRLRVAAPSRLGSAARRCLAVAQRRWHHRYPNGDKPLLLLTAIDQACAAAAHELPSAQGRAQLTLAVAAGSAASSAAANVSQPCFTV